MIDINQLDEHEVRERLVRFGKQMTTEQQLELMGLLTRLNEIQNENVNTTQQTICDAIAEVDAKAELADDKAECAHQTAVESMEEVVDAWDIFYESQIEPVLEGLSSALMIVEGETVSVQDMLTALIDLTGKSFDEVVAKARQNAKSCQGEDWSDGVEDGAHTKSLASVGKNGAPRPFTLSTGDRDGVVRTESTNDDFHNTLVEAVLEHENRVAKYSPTRKLI